MTGKRELSVPVMIARKPEDCLTETRFLTAMKSFVEESNCRARNSSSRLTPSPSMNRRASTGTHLSIGYYSPNWPIGASPNGVVNYVGFLSEQLEAMGHHTTILAEAVAEGDHAPGVYNLQEIRTTIARNPVNRIMYGLWRRLAVHPANRHLYRRALVTTFHRAIAEHDLDIFEMEETFGWARWLRQTSPIPICVRLHGPWFLNGRALGVPEDEGFRRRVEEEGRAIRGADLITAPSRDVLEQTRAFYGLALEDA